VFSERKDIPGSIFEETVRLHRIRHSLLEHGFLEYFDEEELEHLLKTIMWCDLDIHRNQEDWLPDLIKAVKWLYKMHKFSLVEDDWPEMLNTAIRKQSERLDRLFFDDDNGDSWKRV